MAQLTFKTLLYMAKQISFKRKHFNDPQKANQIHLTSKRRQSIVREASPTEQCDKEISQELSDKKTWSYDKTQGNANKGGT